ncbi:MAG: type II toxin-antitoxin system Phd/YefM family antitoxin [Deltaproteobacteria bacterium]|nr:type II toxin-antitoxin system Phd/YefM family antitoxin [Deltaproteobacteria bacterium]
MRQTVNVYQAKTSLSRLLARVEAGEEIIIARAGKPVALLSRLSQATAARTLGRDAGLFEVPEGFDDPLPAEVLASFVG